MMQENVGRNLRCPARGDGGFLSVVGIGDGKGIADHGSAPG